MTDIYGVCKDIEGLDSKDPKAKKLKKLCKPEKETSKSKRELRELRKVTDDTVDVVMKGIITGFSLAVAFLIYSPIQEAILDLLVVYPVWLSTVISVAILIGIMILISYIFIQIRQIRSKEDVTL